MGQKSTKLSNLNLSQPFPALQRQGLRLTAFRGQTMLGICHTAFFDKFYVNTQTLQAKSIAIARANYACLDLIH